MAGSSGNSPGPWLVTGANGFVGRALCEFLHQRGLPFRAVVRRRRDAQGEDIAMGDFAQADWRGVLQGVSCLFHCAARAHVMEERAADPLAEYRRANVEVSARLAEQAAAAGVSRFVFLSTVKVLGEASGERPLTENSPPDPRDDYARSKLEAEEVLAGIGRLSGMDVVILRVPLLYGPAVKGNFLSLLKVVARGWPLPLGSIDNRRSLLYLGNLCAALLAIGQRGSCPSGTWLLSDGDDLSTPQLVRALAQALGVPARAWPCPLWFLTMLAALAGKEAAWERLRGSLAIDASAFNQTFGWHPPYSVAQGLAETAAWYRRRQSLA